ncbi:MAG TPA: tetratricopeptide repeat protein, partial [Nitrosospira sp.]|nr:tetratricopeptide repeat protein [Nitrosospira sp.]
KDEADIMNAVRLSMGLYSFDAASEMLTQLANKRKLTSQEMNSLLSAYNEAGNSSDHVNFLKSYVKRYPDEVSAWEVLAKTQESAGQLTGAIATWRLIGARFDRLAEAVGHEAELTWKNGHPEKALSTLLSNKNKAAPKDTYFWEVLGKLSWELKRPEHGLTAYRILWDSGKGDALVAERLIQATRDMGRPEESIAVGKEAYNRFGQPRWLLLSMDVANQAGLSDELKRLFKVAKSKESEFVKTEMYWLMQAELNTRESRPDIAIKDYSEALKVNPASATAKEGILWNLIGKNDKPALRSYIKTLQSEASKNPSLWGPYGTALAKVGENKEALPWFERKAQISPDDYLWLLSYADVMSKAGHTDAAWRLRKHVLFSLRSRLNEIEKTSEKKIKELLRPEYLNLLRDMEGANTDVTILKKFLAKGYDHPSVHELLMAAYLSQENYPAARYWLLQEHIARQDTPAWQRLSLALGENDLATAEQILESENDRLSDFNKMETLKRLDRNEEALSLTYKLLESYKAQPAVQSSLFNVRDELIVKTSKQVTGGFDYKTLGNINFTESRARFSVPYRRGVLATEVKHTYLNSTDPNIILPANNEVDIAAEYKHPFRQGTVQMNVGGNIRAVDSLVYGGARVSQDISSRVKANLRVGVNELSHETGALRALGKKDTLLLGVSTQLSQQTFLNVDIDGHRYSTREGNTLGRGYKVQAVLGHSLLRGIQDWQVRLQGSVEQNDLTRGLPSDLVGVLNPTLPGVETLIPREFALMGMGTSFRYGATDQGVVRRPFVLGDAWTGYVWPANDLGYNGRLSMAVSLFGPDILSAGAFYSNVQGGRTNQAYAGIGMQYSIRF